MKLKHQATAVTLATAFLATAGATPPNQLDEALHGPAGDVIQVRMIEKSATSYAFEPAQITVRPGDVVRFIQDGAVPHNVEFKAPPEGASIGDIAMGPFLIQKGETYEVSIDGDFVEGTYEYVCTPHAMMGMVGAITVLDDR